MYSEAATGIFIFAMTTVIVGVSIAYSRKRVRRVRGIIPPFATGFTSQDSFSLQPPNSRQGAILLAGSALVFAIYTVKSTMESGFLPGVFILGTVPGLSCLWAALYFALWRVRVTGNVIEYPTWMFARRRCSYSEITGASFKWNGGLKVFVRGKHAFTVDQVDSDSPFGTFTECIMRSGVQVDTSKLDGEWLSTARAMQTGTWAE